MSELGGKVMTPMADDDPRMVAWRKIQVDPQFFINSKYFTQSIEGAMWWVFLEAYEAGRQSVLRPVK